MRPALTVALIAVVGAAGAAPLRHHAAPPRAVFTIPESIKIEHDEIQADLKHIVSLGGKLGARAEEVQKVLHPHFVREEQIALPQLGLLAPLMRRDRITDARVATALSDSLRRELPRMMDDHKAIRDAALRMGHAAQAAGNIDAADLARRLALHAQMEEEVLYPAALLVGDVLRRPRQIGER